MRIRDLSVPLQIVVYYNLFQAFIFIIGTIVLVMVAILE